MIRNSEINRRATAPSGFVALLFALLAGLTACEEPSNQDAVKQPNVTVSTRTTNADAQPLYIVDGKKLPITSSNPKPLAHLNPNDIQSIDILKGEKAISRYGEEGKNGVLLIKTKK